MSETLTGDPYIDVKILTRLNDHDLCSFNQTNKYASRLCSTDELWIKKIINDFGSEILSYRPKGLEIKTCYVDLARLSEIPNKAIPHVVSRLFPQIQKRVNVAANNSQMDMLNWMSNPSINLFPNFEGVMGLINNNNMEVIRWLNDKGRFKSETALRLCMKLRESEIINIACRSGNLDMLIWLEEIQFHLSAIYMDTAAKYGHVHILEWGYESPRRMLPSQFGMINTTINGHLEVLQWLTDPAINILPFQGLSDLAAEYGHVNILNWLEGYELLPSALSANMAAKNGHLDVLKWLEQRGILPTSLGADMAKCEGQIEVLEWLEQKQILPETMGQLRFKGQIFL